MKIQIPRPDLRLTESESLRQGPGTCTLTPQMILVQVFQERHLEKHCLTSSGFPGKPEKEVVRRRGLMDEASVLLLFTCTSAFMLFDFGLETRS